MKPFLGAPTSELTISEIEVVVRLLVTVALCGAIGFERETRDQSAGFRTHILLGLGAALFTLVSAYGFTPFTEAALQSRGRGIQFDPTRITAQVATGVGFLGAGAIIRQGTDIRGLTTAASLWATAAIGVTVGAGYLFGAAAMTVVVVLSLYLLRKLRSLIIPRLCADYGFMSLTFEEAGGDVSRVTELLDRHDKNIRGLDAELEEERAHYSIRMRIPPSRSAQKVLGEIAALPGVKRVGVTGLQDVE
ncbi:MAG: MgtC/SapB family protein [Rubrobacteraceae bacterium]|nr:MgtC/SapB family protein [Rubrobacter sp.]